MVISRQTMKSFLGHGTASALTVFGALLWFSAFAASPAAAGDCFHGQCTYSECHTPARGVPSQLWGELAPTDGGQLPSARDNTDFDQVGDFEVNPYSMALDVEGGWVFMVANRRIQVWNATTNPGNPTRVFNQGFRNSGLTWTPDAHAFFILEDIDAPEGDPNVMALVGIYGVGTAIYDTTTKDNPLLKYQHHGGGFWAKGVYATTIGSNDYAFSAVDQTGALPGGFFAYNMTAAKALTGRCDETTGGSVCPGVFIRKIGTRNRVQSVDGAGNFVAIASGISPRGFEIWNVANPASPTRVMEGLTGDAVYNLAMWQQGSSYYLAVRTQTQGRVYNVSCIANGSCGLGGAIWSQNLVSSTSGTVTFSRSSATPFLYWGAEADCQGGNQAEWLYDVSNPSSPHDISPQGTVVINGEAVSYWGWYYRMNGVHGFNRVAPRMGKFHNNHFFRAGFSIFDIHRRTSGSPPVANFSYTPLEIYPGTAVNFTDQSTGSPTAWDWDFLPDGSPSSSTLRNPTGIQFAAVGTKTVNLQVTNAAGNDTTSQNLSVLDPAPAVGNVEASPNPALVCQSVTFTAQSVTGRPPVSFAWQVSQTGGGVVASGNGNPFIWSTGPSDTTGVTYVAQVTATNSDGSDVANSPAVTLNPLQALPGSNTFAPTYVGQPNDPPTGTVEFNVNVAGATEWNWNFGDNAGGGPDGDGYEGWTSDPVNGPNPTHGYTQLGTFNVRVKVRNCVESERESSPVSVNITSITPLEASFRANLAFCQGGTCFADVGVPIQFIDESTGDPQFWDYDWDGNGSFEDANNSSPETSHTYTVAGDYRPILRVRNGAQQDSFTHVNLIRVQSGNPPPTPTILVNGPTSGTVNQVLTYTASASNCTASPTGWTWTTSGGTISGSSNGPSISVSWSAAGTKIVRATNSGCGTAAGSRAVSITGGGGGGGDLNANFTFSPTSPGVGETVSFDGSGSQGSPTIYTWDFGDGSSASGPQVTHSYSTAGTYSVTLEVSKQDPNDPNCPFGICTDEETRTVVVGDSGPPPLTARFTVNAGCFATSGQEVCDVDVGQELLFTDTSLGEVSSRSWNFGDGGTSTATAPNHTFTSAGTFVVTLTVSNDEEQDSASKTFNVEGTPPPDPPDSVLLPWVAQSDGALDQVSALYVHNPDSQARNLTLRFFERRAPSNTDPAPEISVPVAAGATAYFPDVLGTQFGLSNVSGFIEIEVAEDGALAPTAVSYHRTFNPNGLTFGHAVPAVTGTDFPRAVGGSANGTFHLMGLNDNGARLAFFGLTNPGDTAVQFQLRFFNQLGESIGNIPDPMTIGAKNNRQFQVETLRQTFGIEETSDYRIEIEVLRNGPLFFYGANLRLPALDPSYVRPGDPTVEKVYLLGVLATEGLNNTQWQTDAVLGNVAESPVTASITFTSAGNGADPLPPISETLLSGETLRLSNVLADHFDLDADSSLGFVTIESAGVGGAHPIVQAETYDVANPNGRFGQFMPALRDDQAASAGQRQILTGLQQDTTSRSTLWLLNPGDTAGTYDVIYRALDGSEIGRISSYRVAAGSMRQINPGSHPLVDGMADGGFTVQIVVRRGSLLSAAQVVNSITNDPAFVAGATR